MKEIECLVDMLRPYYRMRAIRQERRYMKNYGISIHEAISIYGKYVRIIEK